MTALAGVMSSGHLAVLTSAHSSIQALAPNACADLPNSSVAVALTENLLSRSTEMRCVQQHDLVELLDFFRAATHITPMIIVLRFSAL